MMRYLSFLGIHTGPALANHLWQSTAFLAAVWLLTLALRRNEARVRYWLWLAASAREGVRRAGLAERLAAAREV